MVGSKATCKAAADGRILPGARPTPSCPARSAQRAWPTALLAAWLGCAGPLGGAVARAATPPGGPFWFRDDYTTWAHVNASATTAAVDTAGSGTVRLPYAPAELSFDPAGTYALVATPGGVFAFVFDGQGVVPVGTWRLGGLAATGAAWIQRGAAFAVSTAGAVTVYGLSASAGGYLAREVAQAPFRGALGVAPGPSDLPAATLVATRTGATLVRAEGASLAAVAGGPSGLSGNAGVAATVGGAVAATWQVGAAEIWVWDGTAYLPAPAWSPPPPPAADGGVVALAFFPQGSGYWELTASGQVLAFAYGLGGLEPVAAASLMVPAGPAPPAGLAAGWSAGALGVLYPGGWFYADLQAGMLRADPARGLTGQSWPLFAGSTVLQSLPIPAPHVIDAVRLEDADCPAGARPPHCAHQAVLPPGTSVSYQVSTDGCQTWTPAPPFVNVAVPPGIDLCYRLRLTTADRTVTPVVDVTDLYEIAAETARGPVPALLCHGVTC